MMVPETNPWYLTENSLSFILIEEAAYWALSKKGIEIVALDLRGKSDVCDFFLICTGEADVQVRALANAVREGLDRIGHPPLHTEGMDEARLALLDFVYIVVHIFRPETREYFLLERLWSDTPRVEIDEAYFSHSVVRQRHANLFSISTGTPTSETNTSDA